MYFIQPSISKILSSQHAISIKILREQFVIAVILPYSFCFYSLKTDLQFAN